MSPMPSQHGGGAARGGGSYRCEGLSGQHCFADAHRGRRGLDYGRGALLLVKLPPGSWWPASGYFCFAPRMKGREFTYDAVPPGAIVHAVQTSPLPLNATLAEPSKLPKPMDVVTIEPTGWVDK